MTMKRALASLLLAAVILGLTGCGSRDDQTDATPEPVATPEITPAPTPEPTEAEDLPWTLERDGTEYEGVYTGEVGHMVPDGEGTFIGRGTGQKTFAWTGGWSFGHPDGPGELTDENCRTWIADTICAGTYRGQAADGIPEGEGEFSAVTAEGVPFTYVGEWKNGLPEGRGTLA